jgi:NIMA-interacting peptidyl-prolyl cis-trans isomerase 4
MMQCEKHGKKEQALEKLKDGEPFDDVAREFSEDKARNGKECVQKEKNNRQHTQRLSLPYRIVY